MKNKILFLLVSLLFVGTANNAENRSVTNENAPPLKLMAAQDTKAMLNDLIGSYQNTSSEKVIVEMQANFNSNTLAIASESDLADPSLNPGWRMLIARDIIVPVTSVSNPVADQISKSGLTPIQLSKVLKGNGSITWNEVIENSSGIPVQVILPENKALREMVINYLGPISHETFDEYASADELTLLMEKMTAAVAFCRLSDITDNIDNKIKSDLKLIPIDKNGDGKLNYYEQIYGGLDEFLRGVWIGKYPNQLVQNIYAIAPEQPTDPASIKFIQWLLTDGQSSLAANGFNELIYSERSSKLNAIVPAIEVEPANDQGLAIAKVVFIAFVLLAVIIFSVNMISLRKAKNKNYNSNNPMERNIIHAKGMKLPKGLYYDKTHTWVYMDENGFVKMGLDDFIQHVTGPYTKIRMKEPGEKVKRNEPVITIIQDGKQLQLYAPVSGTIKEINEDLVTEPAILNDSPYQKGWIYKLEPTNWLREIQFLRMADNYRDWLENEFYRLKDFLTSFNENKSPQLAPVVYQEGGALIDHVLMDMSPQIWEDFQKKFMDVSALS